MGNTKHQKPNTNELPSSKDQAEVSYRRTKENGAWILQDEPTTETQSRHPFDFEERTAVFGESIIRFSKRIPRGPGNDRLINQIVGSGTSVGANFCQANDSVSKKDFRFTAKRCLKEAKETRFFLRMIAASELRWLRKPAGSIAKQPS
jgi:four helix bundle protein